MTVISPIIGSRRVFEITLQDPYEEYKDKPEALPTSEPATPQISFTISSSDLPEFNIEPESVKYVVLVVTSGKNSSGSSGYVYHKMLKNGSEVYSRNRYVANNYYWSFECCYYDVSVGDTLGIKMWASASGFNWDYQLRQAQPTRVGLFGKYICLWECDITKVEKGPTATQGSSPYHSDSPFVPVHRCSVNSARAEGFSNAVDLSPWAPSPTYKLYRLELGDITNQNAISTAAYTTHHPYVRRNTVPVTWKIRPLDLHD